MQEALIDTDILSEIMEGKDAHLVAIAKQYYRVFRRYSVSAATILEIRSGLTFEPKEKDLKNFADIEPALEILPFGKIEAETAGRIIGDLRRKGLGVGRMDPLIAATAIESGLLMVTGNTNHYQRVIDLGYPLQIENWRQP